MIVIVWTYRSMSKGRFASTAPTMLQIHIASQYGNDCFVTCARMILDTWCANCRPHVHKNGTNNAEFKIVDSLKLGELSQKISMATEIGKGSSRSRGRNGPWSFWTRAL